MTDIDMKRQNRIKGPLTERQMTILSSLAGGQRQKEAAETLGYAPSYVSAEMCLVVSKLGVRTTQAAVARYSSYLAYLEAAYLLESGVHRNPVNAAEKAVNEILTGMAGLLRERARQLLPS